VSAPTTSAHSTSSPPPPAPASPRWKRPATLCVSALNKQKPTLTPRAPKTSALPNNSPRQSAPGQTPPRPAPHQHVPGRQVAPRRQRPRGHPLPRRRRRPGQPGACHIHATRQGAQGSATVTHGQSPAADQDRRSRRSAARPRDRSSKLVMRVRFPSPALLLLSQVSGRFRVFETWLGVRLIAVRAINGPLADRHQDAPRRRRHRLACDARLPRERRCCR